MLSWDVSVPKDAIQVKVEKGWLTLSGEVDWNFQRSAAMDDVRKLSGVMGCTNLIHIKSRVQVPDLQKRIEDALKRCAELEAKTIRVSVKDGDVTLEGRVRAWSERDARNPQFGAPRGSRLSRTASRSAVEARLKSDRWGKLKTFGPTFNWDPFNPFERSIPHSEACRTKGIPCVPSSKPPSSSRCELCGGELRFKLIEPANRVYGLDDEIFVCVYCGHEQIYIVARDRYAAR